ncbi:MAG: UpxY family transcription antiterminator [Prolixibacteraceae bacterium]|nr:UpxY family transcription antiterminator [Prolixibacteraceae bacterium]
MSIIHPINKNWYVVNTRSRAEKKVYTELTDLGITCFLPIQKRLRQWKDRKKWVNLPLIAGYCFVYINNNDYNRVLQSDNVVSFISFDGKAAVVPSAQIEQLQQMLKQSVFAVTVLNENFEPGRKVEIVEGPLIGLQGELIDCRGKNRFILRVEHINSVFSVDLPSKSVTLLPENHLTCSAC